MHFLSLSSTQMKDEGGSQWPKLEDHGCKKDQFPVDPELVQDLLANVVPVFKKGKKEVLQACKSHFSAQ